MTSYSKSNQLGRPTLQEERRLGRTRKPKIVEAAGAGLTEPQSMAEWDEATEQAAALNHKNMAKWGHRWRNTCGLVVELLLNQGLLPTRTVSGRNALAVAQITEAWLEDVERATAHEMRQRSTDVHVRAKSLSVSATDAHSACTDAQQTIILTCPACHARLTPDPVVGDWFCAEHACAERRVGGVYRLGGDRTASS